MKTTAKALTAACDSPQPSWYIQGPDDGKRLPPSDAQVAGAYAVLAEDAAGNKATARALATLQAAGAPLPAAAPLDPRNVCEVCEDDVVEARETLLTARPGSPAHTHALAVLALPDAAPLDPQNVCGDEEDPEGTIRQPHPGGWGDESSASLIPVVFALFYGALCYDAGQQVAVYRPASPEQATSVTRERAVVRHAGIDRLRQRGTPSEQKHVERARKLGTGGKS